MDKKYIFKIKTNENYYTNILKIKRNFTIGKTWIVWSLVVLISALGLFLLLDFLVLNEFFPSFEVYLGIFVIGYYLYKALIMNQKFKREHINNLSKSPTTFLVTISQNNFLIKEDGINTAINWNDYSGFEKSSQGIVIGFSDGKLLFLKNTNLPNDRATCKFESLQMASFSS